MTEKTSHPRGTSAHRPDPAWRQARETGRLLEFSAVHADDRLVQRLADVGLRRGELSDLVADGRRLNHPAERVGRQDKLKARHSSRGEIAVVDAGRPMQAAVDKFIAEMQEKSDDSGLF